jgi:hypothetical protein
VIWLQTQTIHQASVMKQLCRAHAEDGIISVFDRHYGELIYRRELPMSRVCGSLNA